MGVHSIIKPVAPIAMLRALPPAPMAAEYQRLTRLAALFAAFDREDIEASVELLLAELDARDGDPDLETGNAEDEALTGHEALEIAAYGPGCPIGDRAESDGCTEADPAWIEWGTRGRHKVDRHGAEQIARDALGNALREDVEDDDPAEANGDELDGVDCAEDEFMRHQADGSGCPVADAPEQMLAAPEQAAGRWGGGQCAGGYDDDEREDDGVGARRPHLRRLRKRYLASFAHA